MSGRRTGNRNIRGPQSALTDFLAANNISAAQIRDDHERRLREAAQQENAGEGSTADHDVVAAAAAADEAAEQTRKRKRNEKAAIEKIKKSKSKKSKKPKKKNGSDDDDEDDDYDDDSMAKDMYKKSRPLPGQFENCEICQKRFTVTPYSKQGPEGGLVCSPCGKDLAKDGDDVSKKPRARKAPGRKRRQIESERLNGVALGGAKNLQQLCIEKVAQYHEDVEELGELPEAVMLRLAEIFAKKRVLNSKTLKLFVRPDSDSIHVHDAAYLEVEDYLGIFAVAPGIKQIIIRNACQFKDECITRMIDKCDSLKYIHLYAPNLVTNEMWHKLFQHYGNQLETLKLSWLDAAFDDDAVRELVKSCKNLKRLKLRLCRLIGEDSINTISKLQHLEHLSLQTTSQVSNEALVGLIESVGSNLRTLSLEDFIDADDSILETVKKFCTKLSKFKLQSNDVVTDSAYANLFTNWKNQPLTFINLSSTRDIDNNNPKGPEDTIGFATSGFKAMMAHSGPSIKTLDISSCRHIALEAFLDVFDGNKIFPNLETINLSFCSCVDTTVIAGIFKSCPTLKKVIAFGCFDITDVVVPRGIALIGVPKAQDAIEQIGVGIGVDEAVGRMVEVGG